MAKLHFYLDKRNDQKENIPVFLFFSYDGQRFKNYTGERIDEKHWNFETERVKRSHPEYQTLNNYLERLGDRIKTIYREAKSSGIHLTNDYFRQKLEAKPSGNHKVTETFQKFIDLNSGILSKNYVNSYKTTLSAIKLYEARKLHNKSIYFETLTHELFEKWVDFLVKDKELYNDSINTYLTRLKTFLEWATTNGYNKNLAFREYDFKGKRLTEDEKEVIFLTWEELMRIHNLKIDNQRLEKVKDFFCFECFTSLRYSDVRNLKNVNIKGDWIKLNTIKKGGFHTIPLNEYAKAILEKYNAQTDGYCLPSKGNKETNKHLRIIGKMANIDEQTQVVRFVGAKRIELTGPKYKFLTTHVGRKTFITLGLAKNVHPKVLMDITGHKTERAFKRYYKIFDNNKMEAMQAMFAVSK